MYAFAKPADFEFPHEKILLKVGRWDDIGSLEGQLVNSRPPEVAIYLRTYLRASFHRGGVNSLRTRFTLVLCEQT